MNVPYDVEALLFEKQRSEESDHFDVKHWDWYAVGRVMKTSYNLHNI